MMLPDEVGSHVRTTRISWDPHIVLGAAAVLVVAAEYGRELVRPVPWSLVELVVATAALALVWWSRERLRLGRLLAVTLVLDVAWILVRRHHTLGLDFEWRDVYAPQGEVLLDGRYPRSQYPAGAVSLFALEAWLGGETTRFVHAGLMVPFHLVTVAAVWSLRTAWSSWLAAIVAFWPLHAWFWEYRFDLVPTALLAAGLALALRRRWELAGASLAVGAAVKWSPALAVLPLVAYLLVSRQARAALRVTAGFTLALAVVYLPYLAWSPREVLHAYSAQGGRDITDESLWHLPLRILGLEDRQGYAYPAFVSVGPPDWASSLSVAVQIAALVALVGLAVRVRTLAAAVALAALMPVVFLMTNRVFSVQYFVLLLAAWAVAGALLARGVREALGVSLVALAATVANVLIVPYPIHVPNVWEAMSAVRFALGLSLTGWLALRAARLRSEPAAGAG